PGLASDSQPNAGYCYYGLAANPSNSVVAASVEGEITGAETQIDGFLVMRINGNWVEIDTDPANTGSQGISGVSDKAINDEGSRIAFVKDGHIFLAPIDNLSAIKQSTPGDHPAFGTKGTGEALAWIQDRKLNIAKLHHCNPPDPGICRNNPEIQAELPGSDEFIVTSLDWNADSRNIVYILSDGSTSEIRQFNVDSRQHSNPIISDRREKTSISIMAN
ncbi:MAG: hypothetical protein HKO64_04015, partial [Xanthomonadales bacterium]|nr:hypothetical protein [Xanthomonadales bacterium]